MSEQKEHFNIYNYIGKRIKSEKTLIFITTISLVFLGSLLGTIFNLFIIGISKIALGLSLVSFIILILVLYYIVPNEKKILIKKKKIILWKILIFIPIIIGFFAIMLERSEEFKRKDKKNNLIESYNQNIENIFNKLDIIITTQDSLVISINDFKEELSKFNTHKNSEKEELNHVKDRENIVGSDSIIGSCRIDSLSVPKQE